eukprot:752546-Hanusia_phi.AAC.8
MIINGVRRGAARRPSSSDSDKSSSSRPRAKEEAEEEQAIASDNVEPLVEEKGRDSQPSLQLRDANAWMQSAAAKKLLERSKEGKRATYSHVSRMRGDGESGSDDDDDEEEEAGSSEAINLRVTIHALKHLPRMDKFGKVDA